MTNGTVTLLKSELMTGKGLDPAAIVLCYLPEKEEFVTWLWIDPASRVNVQPYTVSGDYFPATVAGMKGAIESYERRVARLLP